MEGCSLGYRFLSHCHHTLNYFLNHSQIYPNIAPDGMGYIDASEVLSRPDSFFFNFGVGAVLFTGPEHKIDALFPRKRGAKKYIQTALGFMRGKKIIAEIPSFNLPSRQMAVNFGFQRIGVTGKWLKGGISYDVIRYELEN